MRRADSKSAIRQAANLRYVSRRTFTVVTQILNLLFRRFVTGEVYVRRRRRRRGRARERPRNGSALPFVLWPLAIRYSSRLDQAAAKGGELPTLACSGPSKMNLSRGNPGIRESCDKFGLASWGRCQMPGL